MRNANTLAVTQNPLGLVEVLRDYGVGELGGLFIYLPLPRSSADREAWAWLETARLFNAVRGGPWRIEAAKTPEWLRGVHSKLFVENPVCFEVFRLDRDRLSTLINKVSK